MASVDSNITQNVREHLPSTFLTEMRAFMERMDYAGVVGRPSLFSNIVSSEIVRPVETKLHMGSRRVGVIEN